MAAPMTPDFFPRHSFYCLLDDQPDYLVPTRLVEQRNGHGELLVNPQCWFGWHGPLPPAMAARAGSTAGFYDMPWMVWVEDAGTHALLPFWLGPEYAQVLHEMQPGEPPGVELPENISQILQAAQILVEPDHAARRRKQWLDAVQYYSALFSRGFVALPTLLHPFHVGALRRYYRYHTRAGSFTLGDGQTPGRYVAHNESVTNFFQRQLNTVISDIARTLVKPSYSYLALYQGGAELDRHVDREQCEYSVTLCIDATPEPAAQVPWPLQLGTEDGELSVWQHVGEALFYRGRYLPHWRDRLADGYTSSSILLHYVDIDFAGELA
jgi:hypothetical protein